MATAKATIRKIKTGYVLVPVNDAALPIVAYLYCPLDNAVEIYKREKQQGVMKGQTMSEFIAHVIEVAKGDKIRVKMAGTPRRPILKLYPEVQAKHIPIIKRNVDLKWAAWSAEEGYWEERVEPEILAEMRAAFTGEGPAIEITSSPRKEDRYGVVTISKGKAEGHFVEMWDEVDDLAETLGLLDDEGQYIDRYGEEQELSEEEQEAWSESGRQAFAESLPFSGETFEPGVDRYFEVEAETFDSLLQKVDNEEAKLIEEGEKLWKEIEEMYKGND